MFDVLPPTTPVPPNLLDAAGSFRAISTAELDRIPAASLRLWCHLNARYGLPTVELVAWLHQFIAGRQAIEIGAGHGDLGRQLGIPTTDSRIQERPDVAAFYRSIGQPVIQYPSWIERLEAEEAVARYRPEVVVASWVTHWIDPDLPPPPGGGSIHGVREDRILATGVDYVLIGNAAVHSAKPVLAMPHDEFQLPFVRSRARQPELDRVWVWRKR